VGRQVFCPRCGSTNVRRSHRRGFLERALFQLLGLRPYRCEDCDERFLRGYSKSIDATTKPSRPRREPESSRTEPESHRSASRS